MVDALDSKSSLFGGESSSLSSGTMKNIYIVVGPTSSGKSDYAVKLAKEIDGEVVSADSRQIYKELNLLSGKITESEMNGVPHHMLSIVSITNEYSAELFANDAQKAILNILEKGKTPIICGGSGFYIEALLNKLNGIELPKVEPDIKLREKLESMTNEELFEMIKTKDPDRALTIDKNNKVRLIRAIEIIEVLGSVPKTKNIKQSPYNLHFIGLDFNDIELKNRIHRRIEGRIAKGMLEEAKNVYNLVGAQKMSELGLECKYTAEYIDGKLNKEDLIGILTTKIWQYAKRQRTWFKRNRSIDWVVN